MTATPWEPPHHVSAEEVKAASDRLLGRPTIEIDEQEDVFTIRVLGLDWDIGSKVFSPRDESRIARGADGRRVGAFLLHGGGHDHRAMEPLARFLAGTLGYKVAIMTYPGQLYFASPNHDWPGDTLDHDGTARAPIYRRAETITPDQYDLVEDRSDPVFRAKYGTLFFLRAKAETPMYHRLAAWPAAFEEAMLEVCSRNLPEPDYSVYVHGHSTGGPFVHLLLQRLSNAAGLIGMESSPFGAIFSSMLQQGWPYPFNYITVRTWRDVARYAGPEAGPGGASRLPWLMEDVLEEWERTKHQPNIKAQHIVQFAAFDALEAAARASAQRLAMGDEETRQLVSRFRGYPAPLEGPGVRPVPPLLYGITSGSRDHTSARYREILLPALSRIQPAPRARVVEFAGGVHSYMKAEDGLPLGIGPAVASLWDEAIKGGYYRT